MQQLNKTWDAHRLAKKKKTTKKSLQNQLSRKHLAVVLCTLQEENTADRQGPCSSAEKGLLILNYG